MAHLERTNCCGIDEMDGLDVNPEATIREYCQERFDGFYPEDNETQAFVFFSDTVHSSHKGEDLAKFITKKKLGKIIKTERKRNPNSGNMLQMWVWTPHVTHLRAWHNKNSH